MVLTTRKVDGTTRKVDGRYELGLIWKTPTITLTNKRVVAERRLELLGKRLETDPQLKQKYHEIVENHLQKGYIKTLTKDDLSKPVLHEWYLPHNPVVHPHKPGKVRRDSDIASRYQGISLNDCLTIGPDLLNSLVGILMRFWQEQLAVSADIDATFNQVAVPEEGQSVLRFLWRENPADKMEVYQYSRNIFGAKCSPTCANYALSRTAQDNRFFSARSRNRRQELLHGRFV